MIVDLHADERAKKLRGRRCCGVLAERRDVLAGRRLAPRLVVDRGHPLTVVLNLAVSYG
jgi:hypothetical protein